MSHTKELNFFISELNWHKGLQWYKSNFVNKAKIHGESSTNYTNYPIFDGVPERIYSVVPDAKLIYILRDPIDRIISHYVHSIIAGKEDREISEALKNLKSNTYICRSKYYMQLEQYLRYFPKSNILILDADDMKNNRRQTLQKVFNFIHVDESFYSYKFILNWHKSKYKRQPTKFGSHLTRMRVVNIFKLLPFELRGLVEKIILLPFSHKVKHPLLDDRLRQKLVDFLKDDVNRLRGCAGYDFKRWCL